jgi:D-xylose transport system substrate-binding protein
MKNEPTGERYRTARRRTRGPVRSGTFSWGVVGTVAVLALAGCGSGGGGGSSATGQRASALCRLTDPPTATASAPAMSAPPAGTGAGTVGVILPDTTSSTRYTLYDAPLLQEAFGAAGIRSDIQNAGGDTARFQQIAQAMIGAGVTVLIIDPIDQTSGIAVEQQAAAAGIQVIDYDRLDLGGSAAYYVSFDNVEVGRLQAQALVDCLRQDGVSDPDLIMVDGGTDVDNNAVLFARGANQVLKPLQEKHELTIVSEVVDKGWDIANAAPTFNQALTAAGGQVDAVLAANDDIANAAIGVLQQNGLAGHVVVTGQDAQVEGLQNILRGQQSMTVFKDVALEANAAAALAIALISGQDPAALGISFASGQLDPDNPGLRSVLLPPQVITYSNVQDVVSAGALTAEQVCNGLEQDCTKAGIR